MLDFELRKTEIHEKSSDFIRSCSDGKTFDQDEKKNLSKNSDRFSLRSYDAHKKSEKKMLDMELSISKNERISSQVARMESSLVGMRSN